MDSGIPYGKIKDIVISYIFYNMWYWLQKHYRDFVFYVEKRELQRIYEEKSI